MDTPPKAGYVAKGSRIRAHWYQANDPPSCLAGMMVKFGATEIDVTGVVRHVRGDAPVNPTVTVVYIDIDPDPGTWTGTTTRPVGCTCDHDHVAIDPKHIVGVG